MANKIFGARGLIGNTGYSLNSIPSNLLRSGDMAVVQHILSDGGQDQVYFYKFVENTNKEENSPNIIIPYDSIDNEEYGTWELLNTYIDQIGIDYIYDNIKDKIFAKEFIINTDDWNASTISIYYYNITHNLNELHPIISVWNMFTNRLINVNILSIDENSVRIESTEPLNLKIKILK